MESLFSTPSVPKEPSNFSSFDSPGKWFDKMIDPSTDLMVIYFSNMRCPCKVMTPAVLAMASKYPTVFFARMDVPLLIDVARDFNVKALPTCVLVRVLAAEGTEVCRIVGARPYELDHKIAKYLAAASIPSN